MPSRHNPSSSGSDSETPSDLPTTDTESDLVDESPVVSAPAAAIRKRKQPPGEREEDIERIIVQASWDIYITQNSSRAQTSDNVYSELVPPLSIEEYTSTTQNGFLGVSLTSRILHEPNRTSLFNRIMLQLLEGFNILAYGFGSKRRLLNQFASSRCAKVGHTIVLNGFNPDLAFKDILSSIEHLPGLMDASQPELPASSSSSSLESQCRRISSFFASHSSRPLFLIIHNIDAALFRVPRHKSCLASLALNPHIHILASADHLNSPLIWSLSESSTRKFDTTLHDPSSSSATAHHGFSWLWHDMTTLDTYDFELAYVDRTSLSSAHGGGSRKKLDSTTALNGGVGSSGQKTMSETAALHILASVTQKAKKLFLLLGRKQLQSIEEAVELTASSNNAYTITDLQEHGMPYDKLFHQARSEFIATNETSLRSLLGEFRDHHLILSAPGPSGGAAEVLWIPMRKERLLAVIESLDDENDS